MLISKIVVGFIASLPLVLQKAIIVIAAHGDKLFLALATFALVTLLVNQSHRKGHLLHTLQQVVIAVLGSAIGWFMVILVKTFIATPRPFVTGIVPTLYNAAGHAFPSGHAAMLLCIALSLRNLVSKRVETVLLVLAFVVPLFRFFVGAHSIVDILVGWIIGYLLSIFIVHEEKIV